MLFSSLLVKGLALGVYLQAHDGILPEIKWPTWLSEDCKQLILKMICYDPRERCNISEVCEGLRRIRLNSGKLAGRQSSGSSKMSKKQAFITFNHIFYILKLNA